MSDAFRLTPHDVRSQPFARAMRGLDRAEVETFLQRVAEELEGLLRDRAQQEERLLNAQEQLKAYRERERALNEALVAAQQLRADTRDQAQREAEAVIREARTEAAHLVERAQLDERQVRERAELAARQFGAYLASVRAGIERQLAELDGLQAIVESGLPARGARTDG